MLNPTSYDMEGKRIKKRITLREIMNATGIKISRLSEIEKERTTPTEQEARAIREFIEGYGRVHLYNIEWLAVVGFIDQWDSLSTLDSTKTWSKMTLDVAEKKWEEAVKKYPQSYLRMVRTDSKGKHWWVVKKNYDQYPDEEKERLQRRMNLLDEEKW